jgi:competence protein ComEC
VLVWQAALAAPDGRLRLTLLDVGSGDALLVQTPSGRSLLIDGGPSGRALGDGLGRRLPLFSRRLDWLVVAAAGEEQLGGLPLGLERFPPAQVLWAGQVKPGADGHSARELQEQLAKLDVPILTAETGQALDLGEGAALRVLAAGESGAVLALEWGEFHALLPVGQDQESLEALLAGPRLNHADVLLLADCGSAALNPPEWLAKLAPRAVLLSVAPGDLHGRPDPQVLDVAEGYNLLRTDRDGWVKISTDGVGLWVEVERR